MVMKKYEFTGETKIHNGVTLQRIRAVRSFGDVEKGQKGGWIEREENLSVYVDASVYGNAWVSGDACVSGNARVTGVEDYVLDGEL